MPIGDVTDLIHYKFSEHNAFYRKQAKIHDLSQAEFKLLYLLVKENKMLSQKEVCDYFHIEKQTINAATKSLMLKNYIELYRDGHTKKISLTSIGKEAADFITSILNKENYALNSLGENQSQFLKLLSLYTAELEKEF